MNDSPLGKLPAELRNKIYHYLLTTNESLIVQVLGDTASTSHISLAGRHLENRQGHQVKFPHALALTCRQAYLEAMSLFYTVVEFGINVEPLAKTRGWGNWVVLRTFEALKYVTTTVSPRHLCCVQSLTIYLRPMKYQFYEKLIMMILANDVKPSTIVIDVGRVEGYWFRRPHGLGIASHIISLRRVRRILSRMYRAQQGSPKCKLILSIESFCEGYTRYLSPDCASDGLVFMGAGLRIDTSQIVEEADRLERMGLGESGEDLAEVYKLLVKCLRSIWARNCKA